MAGSHEQQQHRFSDFNSGPATYLRERDDDELSLIDVLEFDDTADEKWLCSMGSTSRRSSIGGKVEDLDAWLHADTTDLDAARIESSKRMIDTRTFTRMKRRSGRLSFDGQGAAVSPDTMPLSMSNLWKNPIIPEGATQNNNNNEKEQTTPKGRKDSIPMMLRPKSNQVLAALLSESPTSISSQASMEAFLNAARSKEGPSSIVSNASDGDVNSFLMNVSQPSLLYSSIISDGKGDESVQQHRHHANVGDSLTDSQILTDSMMEASMFKEVQDTTMLAQFLKQNNDGNILEDITFCMTNDTYDSNDKTFDANDRTFIQMLNDRTIDDKNVKFPNETFVASEHLKADDSFSTPPLLGKHEYKLDDSFSTPPLLTKNDLNFTKTLCTKETLLDTTLIISKSIDSLNSTKTLSTQNTTFDVMSKDLLSTTQTISGDNKTDLTFELKSKSSSPIKQQLNATYEANNYSPSRLPNLNDSNKALGKALDSTFDAIPNLRAELLQEVQRSSGNKFDSTFTSAQLPKSENKFDVTYDRPGSVEPVECLDETYIQVQSTHQNLESQQDKKCLDMTYNNVQSSTKLINAVGMNRMSYTNKPRAENQTQQLDPNRFNTFKKENIAEFQAQQLDQNRFNTFKKENIAEFQAQQLDPNRFNTFRKDSSKFGSRLSKVSHTQENNKNATIVPTTQQNVPNTVKADDNAMNRYNTFVKKSSIAKSNMGMVKNTNDMKRLEATFVKPVENNVMKSSNDITVVKNNEENKLETTFVKPVENKIPRQIPAPRQLSRLPQLFQKSHPNLGSNMKAFGKSALDADSGFHKGSQPNISTNMPALGRFKSERVLQMKHMSEAYSTKDSTSRSMESIESTASVHSAPDLDDRLSLCSDNSRGSYTVKPRNLEVIKKFSSLDEGSGGKFNGSTPKVKRQQILENTWVEENNLPSPILKNGNGKSYTESGDSRSTSPTDSSEFNVKTSSPLTISPAVSDQAINNIGHIDDGIEASKENNQASQNVRPKQLMAPKTITAATMPAAATTNATKLRQPTNWTGGPNKVANGSGIPVSGIPRPASRIPGPKFTRPNLK